MKVSSIVFSDESTILADSIDPDLTYHQLIRPGKSRLGLFYVIENDLFMDIALILITLLSLISRKISLKLLSLEASELFYAGILSSGLAFLLQIIALQNLSPAPAAIIFSLEGVFASVAAWIILDQYLNEFKILGIIIILSAVIFSQLAPIYGKKIYGRN